MNKDKRDEMMRLAVRTAERFSNSYLQELSALVTDMNNYILELETRVENSIPGRQPFTGDAYLDTIARIEPEIAPIDAAAFHASAAISLKRIADALSADEKPAQPTLECFGWGWFGKGGQLIGWRKVQDGPPTSDNHIEGAIGPIPLYR